MKSKQIDQSPKTFILVFETGDELAKGLLEFAEQEKLSLDDKLAKHFPDFSHRPDVTVRQLLTHTSGLHSYTDKPEFMSRVIKPIEPADLVNAIRAVTPAKANESVR